MSLRVAVLAGVGVFAMAMPLMAARGRKVHRLATGRWGGPHAELSVAADGAHLDFDCAEGHIPGPLTVKADGRFDLKGTYRPQRPGPQWEDDAPGPRAHASARYQGRVDGDTLTLTVTSSDHAEVGTFTLTQGRAGVLRKCL